MCFLERSHSLVECVGLLNRFRGFLLTRVRIPPSPQYCEPSDRIANEPALGSAGHAYRRLIEDRRDTAPWCDEDFRSAVLPRYFVGQLARSAHDHEIRPFDVAAGPRERSRDRPIDEPHFETEEKRAEIFANPRRAAYHYDAADRVLVARGEEAPSGAGVVRAATALASGSVRDGDALRVRPLAGQMRLALGIAASPCESLGENRTHAIQLDHADPSLRLIRQARIDEDGSGACLCSAPGETELGEQRRDVTIHTIALSPELRGAGQAVTQ